MVSVELLLRTGAVPRFGRLSSFLLEAGGRSGLHDQEASAMNNDPVVIAAGPAPAAHRLQPYAIGITQDTGSPVWDRHHRRRDRADSQDHVRHGKLARAAGFLANVSHRFATPVAA